MFPRLDLYDTDPVHNTPFMQVKIYPGTVDDLRDLSVDDISDV